MVGATECESCAAKILAIAPVVPIVPDIHKDVHRMWQSYNAFTFAFQPYIDADLMGLMDDPRMLEIFQIVDPINFIDRLEKIPKFFFVSSDDEFMSMDWTNLGYYDAMKGEKHLLIKSNAEHSMATGLYTVMSIYGTMVRSFAAGIEKRPTINYEYNKENGHLSAIIPRDQAQPSHVKLKYGETISTERRDFRWMVQSNEFSGINCTFPYIPLSATQKEEYSTMYNLEGSHQDLCFQPIIWRHKTLHKSHETADGDAVYTHAPPTPRDGHWMGYYIEVTFPGDTPQGIKVFQNEFVESTPGYTWPDTLPFDDCHAEGCLPRTV